MRLPYQPPASRLWNTPTVAQVLSRRALRPDGSAPSLLPLDRALLHSPPVALGWNALLGALRDKADLSAHAFELSAVRVAALAGARFEWDQHAPLLEKALRKRGDDEHAVTAVLSAVRDGVPGAFASAGRGNVEVHTPDGVVVVQAQDAAVLALVDAMTREPERGLSDGEWTAAREAVGGAKRTAVELVASVAAYNMVARFLVALDIGERGVWRERLRGRTATREKARL